MIQLPDGIIIINININIIIININIIIYLKVLSCNEMVKED